MVVYFLFEKENGREELAGVFSSQEKAQAALAARLRYHSAVMSGQEYKDWWAGIENPRLEISYEIVEYLIEQ